MSRLTEHRARLVNAILKAVAEHGYPNGFSPSELHRLYGGPPPMIAGRIASDTWAFSQLQKETGLGRQLSYNTTRKTFCV